MLTVGDKQPETVMLDSQELVHATLKVVFEGGEEDAEQQVWIYLDRVFWPCDE